jgi:hypothetical protein
MTVTPEREERLMPALHEVANNGTTIASLDHHSNDPDHRRVSLKLVVNDATPNNETLDELIDQLLALHDPTRTSTPYPVDVRFSVFASAQEVSSKPENTFLLLRFVALLRQRFSMVFVRNELTGNYEPVP